MENALCRQRQRWERCSYKPRNAKTAGATSSWRSRRILSRAFGGGAALPTPPSYMSGLQHCERINSCCFTPPSVWSFVTASVGQIFINCMDLGKPCTLLVFDFLTCKRGCPWTLIEVRWAPPTCLALNVLQEAKQTGAPAPRSSIPEGENDHKMKISKIPGVSGHDKAASSAWPAQSHPQL